MWVFLFGVEVRPVWVGWHRTVVVRVSVAGIGNGRTPITGTGIGSETVVVRVSVTGIGNGRIPITGTGSETVVVRVSITGIGNGRTPRTGNGTVTIVRIPIAGNKST